MLCQFPTLRSTYTRLGQHTIVIIEERVQRHLSIAAATGDEPIRVLAMYVGRGIQTENKGIVHSKSRGAYPQVI